MSRYMRAVGRAAIGCAMGFGGTTAWCRETEKPSVELPPGVHCYPQLDYGKWVVNWDGMAPHPEASDELKAKLKKAPARHLILIRHGQYDLEFKGDPPLTKLGEEQARIVGERIKQWTIDEMRSSPKSKPRKVVVNRVVSSDMMRAKQTGEIIAEVLGVKDIVVDPMLAEGAPCPVENWNPTPRECFTDSARIEAAFRKYCHRSVDGYEAHTDPKESYEGPPTYDVISCHGNVIRYFVMRSLQLPPTAWLRTATYNTGITHLVFYPTGKVSLYGFGDTGHLRLDKTTYH
eukprot:TRINITY_DN1692_c0_g2_i1.p1 TRINITY_DN1692_c0_g2~~TRINITY_DN1692_c0_g2_i1.p1  ORF type:complete len:289 (+),score=56.98 TRINITY_DN1692_c0_g2_i1:24-890(+)